MLRLKRWIAEVSRWSVLRRHRWLGRGAVPEPPDARRAFERLAEDEALRGDLTDAGYNPLLSMMASLAIARQDRFRSTDELYLALRQLLHGAVQACEAQNSAPILAAARVPLFSVSEHATLSSKLAELHGSSDAVAAALAEALRSATGVDA